MSLDSKSKRLICLRLPFVQIRRLRAEGYAVVEQVINVPVDVNTMVQHLTRNLDDNKEYNVIIEKRLIHKAIYLRGVVRKRVVRAWLEYLKKHPLFKHFKISIDFNSEVLAARQQSLLWNEEHCLDIAPGQNCKSMNLIYDVFAEELSFPSIYYGVGRKFRDDVHATP
ncbi:hypothetical protein AVEN_59572-1 [Araneus ventricosus]|uniref:DUF6570 domain-containing protein n=1 Tax=Araneus ventricosus TaxID=182803 RepID=A0A4Y2G559_ARAVE|nr:hypothetical protein AVEN_59572-1 [Araneus ventricosus]